MQYNAADEEEVDPIQELIDFGISPENAAAIHNYALLLQDDDEEDD